MIGSLRSASACSASQNSYLRHCFSRSLPTTIQFSCSEMGICLNCPSRSAKNWRKALFASFRRKEKLRSWDKPLMRLPVSDYDKCGGRVIRTFLLCEREMYARDVHKDVYKAVCFFDYFSGIKGTEF